MKNLEELMRARITQIPLGWSILKCQEGGVELKEWKCVLQDILRTETMRHEFHPLT